MNYPPLHHMVGQLFLIGFIGDRISPDHPVYRDIEERNLGGVILFDRHLSSKSATNNIVGKDQLCALTSDLQNIRPEKLLIAVDQEGGKVNRFRKEFGFPVFAEATELGKTDDRDFIQQSAAELSAMLKECGVNWNLAPVVDLNINPENPIIGKVGRSFSHNPDAVAECAKIWIKAHNKNRILTCLKHFPGHGSSEKDSHLGFVDITRSWRKEELTPYRDLIGKKLAAAIMLGHLFHEGFDSELPTSLSPQTVICLREQLGFTGVIVTDDMQMRAITDKFEISKACIMAIQAGVDIVIIGNNLSYDPDLFAHVHNDVMLATDKGILDIRLVQQSWERIQKFKNLL